MTPTNQLSQMTPDDEIDLIDLAKALWDGRWIIIIITTCASLIGLSTAFLQLNTYNVKTTLAPAPDSYSNQFLSLNETLEEQGYAYRVDSESVFKKFVDEFIDYEEVLELLQDDAFVINSVKDLQDEERRDALASFAKLFAIVPPPKEGQDWTISFEWHDVERGREIASQALDAVASNVQRALITDVEQIAESTVARNLRIIDEMSAALLVVKRRALRNVAEKLLFLRGQADLARDLNIADNSLGLEGLIDPERGRVALSIQSADVPYYLRGYRAIEKEMTILSNLSEEETLLLFGNRVETDGVNSATGIRTPSEAFMSGYAEINDRLFSAQNDLTAQKIRARIGVITSAKPDEFVEYNLDLADVESNINTLVYFIFSLVLGGLTGCVYVLFSNALRKRKDQLSLAKA